MNPVVIGIVNAVVPGVGYLILRKRTIFGALILVSGAAWFIGGFFESYIEIESFLISTTVEGKILEAISIAATMLAFGYDAYTLAKE